MSCWPSTAQHSTAQHSTAQHSTAQHSTASMTEFGGNSADLVIAVKIAITIQAGNSEVVGHQRLSTLIGEIVALLCPRSQLTFPTHSPPITSMHLGLILLQDLGEQRAACGIQEAANQGASGLNLC